MELLYSLFGLAIFTQEQRFQPRDAPLAVVIMTALAVLYGAACLAVAWWKGRRMPLWFGIGFVVGLLVGLYGGPVALLVVVLRSPVGARRRVMSPVEEMAVESVRTFGQSWYLRGRKYWGIRLGFAGIFVACIGGLMALSYGAGSAILLRLTPQPNYLLPHPTTLDPSAVVLACGLILVFLGGNVVSAVYLWRWYGPGLEPLRALPESEPLPDNSARARRLAAFPPFRVMVWLLAPFFVGIFVVLFIRYCLLRDTPMEPIWRVRSERRMAAIYRQLGSSPEASLENPLDHVGWWAFDQSAQAKSARERFYHAFADTPLLYGHPRQAMQTALCGACIVATCALATIRHLDTTGSESSHAICPACREAVVSEAHRIAE